ncbi:MAG: hypothetical protein M3081_03725, partial [Gemmatimonadota bacterium]|nr:hypothetical protein [Gemmatimonadota bacterium]
MTVNQLVDRERSRLGVAIIARGLGLVLAIVAALAGISTLVLGDARWIARPSLPIVSWIVAVA